MQTYPPRHGEGDHPEDGGGTVEEVANAPPSALRAATSPFNGGFLLHRRTPPLQPGLGEILFRLCPNIAVRP